MRNLPTPCDSISTLIMVRTECCQNYKMCGVRCSMCPDHPANRQAVRRYLHQIGSAPTRRPRIAQSGARPVQS